MLKESPQDLVPKFFNGNNSDSYDRIVRCTTFGRDGFWKHRILEQLSAEKTVLDLACGTGILTEQIAQKLDCAEITGVDITGHYLDKARQRLELYPNISLINQDAERLNLGKKFDCITTSYLPKYCTPDTLIKSCLRHLNPGGKIVLHDFTYPKNRLMQKMWNAYFGVLDVAGSLVPSWRRVFADLPSLIRTSNWAEEYTAIMKRHKLKVFKEHLTCGTSAIVVGTDAV